MSGRKAVARRVCTPCYAHTVGLSFCSGPEGTRSGSPRQTAGRQDRQIRLGKGRAHIGEKNGQSRKMRFGTDLCELVSSPELPGDRGQIPGEKAGDLRADSQPPQLRGQPHGGPLGSGQAQLHTYTRRVPHPVPTRHTRQLLHPRRDSQEKQSQEAADRSRWPSRGRNLPAGLGKPAAATTFLQVGTKSRCRALPVRPDGLACVGSQWPTVSRMQDRASEAHCEGRL